MELDVLIREASQIRKDACNISRLVNSQRFDRAFKNATPYERSFTLAYIQNMEFDKLHDWVSKHNS